MRAAPESRRQSRFEGVAHSWMAYSAVVYSAFQSTPSSAEMRHRIGNSNINKQTFLATDYLNHFNEMAMLLELLPGMPEMLVDVKIWRPKGYKEHFRGSTFSDRDLAADAYDCVPTAFLMAFEGAVWLTNKLIVGSIPALEEAIVSEDWNRVANMVCEICGQLDGLMSRLRGIINGELGTLGQGEIDALLRVAGRDTTVASPGDVVTPDVVGLSQRGVNALFG